jgi:hypothetical protein
MKKNICSSVLLLACCMAVCLNLSADVSVLGSGHILNGEILKANGSAVTLGYSNGRLLLSRDYVQRMIEVGDLSDYGKNSAAPAARYMSGVEKSLLALRTDTKPAAGVAEPSFLLSSLLRTRRYSLTGGVWELSFELPAGWVASEKEAMIVLEPPANDKGVSIVAAVTATPPVDISKQAELIGAAADLELGNFKHVYSLATWGDDSGSGRCTLLGTYGPSGSFSVLRVVFHRTATHTFSVAFFVPSAVYADFESVFSVCLQSIRLREAGD